MSADEAAALSSALERLWASRYVFRVRPCARLEWPLAERGTTLRGAFGLLLRQRVCHDLALDCRACPKLSSCVYPDVFAPAPPPDATRLRWLTDVPRPFAFDPPRETRDAFDPADELTFGLVVIGRANCHWPDLSQALHDLARAGLGRRRVPLEVVAVEVEAADGARRPAEAEPTSRLRASDLAQPGDAARTQIELRFETPLELREAGRPVERPEFAPLLRRLRDRAAALATFYGDGPLELDFRRLGERAESVRLVEDRTRRVRVPRVSGRTHQRHDVGGRIGQARYEGQALGELMPLLRLGELIHVGRHAAFGNGRMTIL